MFYKRLLIELFGKKVISNLKKMKKYKLILVFNLASILSFGQTLPIKEKFDFLSIKGSVGSYTRTSLNDESDYGDGFCKILEGYISMYEVTKDKAYLYRFIVESLKIMSTRHDNYYTSSPTDNLPRWTYKYSASYTSNGLLDLSSSNYIDGYIVAAFSRFGYIVSQDPVLAQTSLHNFNEILPGYQFNYTGITFTTFGHYANWLEDRVHETINYFIYDGYWSDTEGYLKRRMHNNTNLNIFDNQIVNMQAGFARALLFNALSTGNVDFMNRANIIAARMVGEIYFSPIDQGPWLIDQANNSYYWYYNGWNTDINNGIGNSNNYRKHEIEDMSHGAIDVNFFYDFWKYQPNQDITNSNMVKFHNTFSNFLYDGYGGFWGSVNGTDYKQNQTYVPVPEYIPHNKYKYASLLYSNLAEFEHFSPSYGNTVDGKKCYQICKDFYILNLNNLNEFNDIPSNVPYNEPFSYAAGALVQSISLLANQQWQRECVDLSLFKRKLVYDQDFAAQGVLTIEPRADLPLFNSPTSFALPYITTNEFTIEAGVTSTIEGGFGVIIKDGFTAKMGSNVTIKPTALPCVKSMGSYVVLDDQPSEPTQQNSRDADEIINQNELSIYPNPASNTFTITISKFVNTFMLEIVDIQGKTMHTQSITSSNEVINISSLSSGIYFCKITNGDEVITQKLIVE